MPLLLAAEGILWLSKRFQWFAFNQHKGWTVLVAVGAVGVFLLLTFLWFLLALVFKWRFQYSLLSLMVLMVVVALTCGWLAAEMKAAKEQRAAAEEIRKLGGQLGYDYQRDWLDTTSKPPEPAWMRGLLGDDLFMSVTDANLTFSEISDPGLEHLKGLTKLQELDVIRTRVSAAGVKKLQQALPKCHIWY